MLLLPAPVGLEPEAWRTAAIGVLMAVWWMTEALPIPATALVPLVLFPLLGVTSIEGAAAPYANPLIFLFMGGFMIAIAMQRWGLHRRIALTVIRWIGAQPTRIVAGFMISAAFLSLWISNTATAMMMLPIGLSVVELARTPEQESASNFAVVLMLAIAYACSVGGLGTLIGTPTNALFAAFMLETYGVEIDFLRWMLLAMPLVMLVLPLIFWVLVRGVYPIKLKAIPGGREYIDAELDALGPMARPEKMVAVVFALTAAAWIGRRWLNLLVPELSDAGIAMLGATVLFVLPVNLRQGRFVLNWEWARRLPWGVLILFGGGLSLAAAISNTGLASWIGGGVGALANWPLLLIIASVVALVVLLTELTSNTATTAAFLPIVASVAIGLGQNPLFLMVPATLAASCAFMLPVATPPNAIIYGSSFVTVPQMVRAGIWLNILLTVILAAWAYSVVPIVLDVEIGVVPPWATRP